MLKPCIACGEPTDQSRCPDHRLAEPRTQEERGYGWRWDELSRRARRLQNFCTDCGATEGLQADHSPEAWRRRYAGKPIRLKDIDVVCGPCNVKRGEARPGSRRATQAGRGQPDASRPVGKAKFESETA